MSNGLPWATGYMCGQLTDVSDRSERRGLDEEARVISVRVRAAIPCTHFTSSQVNGQAALELVPANNVLGAHGISIRWALTEELVLATTLFV